MRDRRARVGLVSLVGGVVVLVADLVLKLGWTGFFPALLLLAVGVGILVKGHDASGPRTTLAYCMALAVIFLGFGWLHPQRWSEPGWKLDHEGTQLIQRRGGTVYFWDGGFVSARSLTSGSLLWHRHIVAPQADLTATGLLMQLPNDPTRATRVSLSTGVVNGIVPWPTNHQRLINPTESVQSSVPTGQPTAEQLARMPALHDDEHVIAAAGSHGVAARLDAAVDATGHHYTRLDIVAGKTQETYRAKDATGLQIVDATLVVVSSRPHVIALQRNAPKKKP